MLSIGLLDKVGPVRPKALTPVSTQVRLSHECDVGFVHVDPGVLWSLKGLAKDSSVGSTSDRLKAIQIFLIEALELLLSNLVLLALCLQKVLVKIVADRGPHLSIHLDVGLFGELGRDLIAVVDMAQTVLATLLKKILMHIRDSFFLLSNVVGLIKPGDPLPKCLRRQRFLLVVLCSFGIVQIGVAVEAVLGAGRVHISRDFTLDLRLALFEKSIIEVALLLCLLEQEVVACVDASQLKVGHLE